MAKLTLEEFTEYFKAVVQLREYYKEIVMKKAVLMEIEGKMKRKGQLKWIIPIVTGIVSGVIAGGLLHCFLR